MRAGRGFAVIGGHAQFQTPRLKVQQQRDQRGGLDHRHRGSSGIQAGCQGFYGFSGKKRQQGSGNIGRRVKDHHGIRCKFPGQDVIADGSPHTGRKCLIAIGLIQQQGFGPDSPCCMEVKQRSVLVKKYCLNLSHLSRPVEFPRAQCLPRRKLATGIDTSGALPDCAGYGNGHIIPPASINGLSADPDSQSA